MSRPRLCEIKNAAHEAAKKIVEETNRTPGFKFILDELRCPHGNQHCDRSKPCEAMKDGTVRLRIARIEDELFRHGFVRTSSEEE